MLEVESGPQVPIFHNSTYLDPQVGLKRNLGVRHLMNVNVKTTMFIFIVKLKFLVMAIIIGCEAQSTPFPWNIEPNT